MYPEYMQESLRKVEKTRAERLKKAKSGKPIFSIMSIEEREGVLNKFHPDYKEGSKRVVRVGPNKGELITAQVADLLESNPRVASDSFNLKQPDYTTVASPAMSDYSRTAADSYSLPPDALLPASTFASCLQGLFTLEPELRDIVIWRFQGLPYKEIAQRQGTSTQLAEMRHKRALRDWPELEALFPEKMAKQSRRKSRR